MKGSEAMLLGFMAVANNRYVIPVYQRKYDWKIENCSQLYEDLKKIIRKKRSSHFFGSICSQVIPNGSKIEFHIIDGQQRLTTITLLLLAMSNLVKAGRVQSEEEDLNEQILQRFVIAPWAKKDDKIKLLPVRGDRDALAKLFGPVEDYDRSSNLTINYQFFYDQVLREEVTGDELYDAIEWYYPSFGLHLTLPFTLHLYPQGRNKAGIQLTLAPGHTLTPVTTRSSTTTLRGLNPWKLAAGLGLTLPKGFLTSINLTADLLPSYLHGPLEGIHQVGITFAF